MIVLVRHGETEWSATGRHTGGTDVRPTAHGAGLARARAPRLATYDVGLVLCSPLQRAWRTSALAGLVPERDDDLLERGYGAFEGRTTAEIRADLEEPDWSVWDTDEGGVEPLASVGERCRRVLARCAPVTAEGRDVVLVAHAHLLRVLAATWLGLPPVHGRSFVLDAAGLGELGHERETPVLHRWNV